MELPVCRWEDLHDTPMDEMVKGRLPLRAATAFLLFQKGSVVQRLLHQVKYQKQQELALYLGKLMAAKFMDYAWFSTVDAVVPVPLHPRKWAMRGFNQAQLLATGLGKQMGIPELGQLVRRVRFTDSQTKKSRVERVLNLQEAFAARKLKKPKHLLLVDDVFTTGATLEACALAILEANPQCQISIATFAVAT